MLLRPHLVMKETVHIEFMYIDDGHKPETERQSSSYCNNSYHQACDKLVTCTTGMHYMSTPNDAHRERAQHPAIVNSSKARGILGESYHIVFILIEAWCTSAGISPSETVLISGENNYYLTPIGGGRGIVMPMSVCLFVCLSVFSQNFKV